MVVPINSHGHGHGAHYLVKPPGVPVAPKNIRQSEIHRNFAQLQWHTINLWNESTRYDPFHENKIKACFIRYKISDDDEEKIVEVDRGGKMDALGDHGAKHVTVDTLTFLKTGAKSNYDTWKYEIADLRPNLSFDVSVYAHNEVGEGPSASFTVCTTKNPSVATHFYHSRNQHKIRMAWRFDDPKGEDGKVLHCFAVVIPANSDIKVEQIHAFTKQSDAFENIDEEYKREIPERMKRMLFEPRSRARQGIRRPYDRAEEGPLKPDEGVERDPVVYVLKNPGAYGHSAFDRIVHHNHDARSFLLGDGSIVTKVMRPLKFDPQIHRYHTIMHAKHHETYDCFVWAKNAAGISNVTRAQDRSIPKKEASDVVFVVPESIPIKDIETAKQVAELEALLDAHQ